MIIWHHVKNIHKHMSITFCMTILLARVCRSKSKIQKITPSHSINNLLLRYLRVFVCECICVCVGEFEMIFFPPTFICSDFVNVIRKHKQIRVQSVLSLYLKQTEWVCVCVIFKLNECARSPDFNFELLPKYLHMISYNLVLIDSLLRAQRFSIVSFISKCVSGLCFSFLCWSINSSFLFLV